MHFDTDFQEFNRAMDDLSVPEVNKDFTETSSITSTWTALAIPRDGDVPDLHESYRALKGQDGLPIGTADSPILHK
jgi:hypothetical protein